MSGRKKSEQPEGRAVGVRELKTHAAAIVREVREARASYVVTHHGRPVGVLLPLDAATDRPLGADDGNADVAWDAFLRAGRRVASRWKAGVSAAQMLSDMRR